MARNLVTHFTTHSKNKYDVYVGIDQTGAVHSSGPRKGLPKPLPAAVFVNNTLFTGLSLPAFNPHEIRILVDAIPPSNRLSNTSSKKLKVFVAVDAVLGLPEECAPKFDRLLKTVTQFQTSRRMRNEAVFGRDAAFEFFLQFLPMKLRTHVKAHGRAIPPFRLPERTCERLANANSVFNRFPAQRNIGCGSYRILSDLANGFSGDGRNGETKICVWPHQALNDAEITISEVYPSQMWRILGISSTRQEKSFLAYCRKNLELVERVGGGPKVSADHVDAAVSAIGARHVIEAQGFFMSAAKHDFGNEGWILGLPFIENLKEGIED